jgi:predicted nucleic acid-binding Zn ribbon protein
MQVQSSQRRSCARCCKEIAPEKRWDAVFCSDKCSNPWEYGRQKLRATSVAEVEQILKAARDAFWYRLAIRAEDDEVWIYPPANRPYPRFDRVKRATLGFRVRPYEPPNLPLSGLYALMLFDEAGRDLPRLSGVGGLRLEPLPRQRPPRIDAGDRRS